MRERGSESTSGPRQRQRELSRRKPAEELSSSSSGCRRKPAEELSSSSSGCKRRPAEEFSSIGGCKRPAEELIWKVVNLCMVYAAQHAFHHLENHMQKR